MVNQESLKSKSFWSELLPSLKIDELKEFSSNSSLKVGQDILQTERQRLDYDGHFQFKSVLDLKIIETLSSAVQVLNENNIPPLFLSLFDEFWQLVADLRPIGETLLGEEYLILPDYWVWNVDHKTEQKGWRPHRESIVKSSDPNIPVTSISLWVSLTEATTDNGCMMVLPKSKDKGYPNTLKFDISTLQDVKALPVPAGSIIGWDQSLFHWGGSNSKFAKNSRTSFAMELRKVSAADELSSMIKSNHVPSFEERINLVSMQYFHYKHLHSDDSLLKDFAVSTLGADYVQK